MEPTSKFALGAKVTIGVSGESGTVVGIAFYVATQTSYLVRYRAGDGRAVEAWWNESALEG